MKAVFRIGRIGVAVGALFLGAAVAGPAPAWEESECREDCQEARKICHRAAKAAHRVCWDHCQEHIADALRRARALCDQEELTPLECARLVSEAGVYAAHECREDCRKVKRRARKACRNDREECRMVCVPDDPECALDCRDDFAGCRVDLDECQGECGAAHEAEVAACDEFVSDVCDPEAYAQCLHEARAHARLCRDECHGENTCAPDLRECLGDCRVDADSDGEGDG